MNHINRLSGIQYWQLAASALALLLLFSSASAQAQKNQGPVRCHTMENLERLMKANPEYAAKRAQFEQQLKQRSAQQKNLGQAFQEITIPVVFHIIHNGDAIGVGENISNARITAQMAQLNADFRRTNSDAGSTPLEFQDEAADTHIEFCLATTDPDGQPTTGINRVDIATLTNVNLADCWEDFYIDGRIKTATIWNSHLYLNIWVVEKIDDACAPTLLGYAQFPWLPDADEDTDGVVVVTNTVGSLAFPSGGGGPYDRGRTLTHEVGHWLGLFHIWGDDLGLCTGTDAVGDTPNQADANGGCPAHPKVSCGNNEMFMNYMDYTDDLCMNMFTLGQAVRMNDAIEVSRPGTVNDYCGNCPQDLRLSQTEPRTLGVFDAQADNTLIGYDVDLTLEASNTVAPTATVEYRAGDGIRLLPDPGIAGTGFWAQQGSNFRAYIQDCDVGTKPRAMAQGETQEHTANFAELSVSPNPASGNISIRYRLHSEDQVYLSINSPTGTVVKQLKNGEKTPAGAYELTFNTAALPSGVYHMALYNQEQMLIKKFVLIH